MFYREEEDGAVRPRLYSLFYFCTIIIRTAFIFVCDEVVGALGTIYPSYFTVLRGECDDGRETHAVFRC